MKNLSDVLAEAEAKALLNGAYEETCIGSVEEYSPADLADPGTSRITVRDRKVFFVAHESDLHQTAVDILAENIQGALAETRVLANNELKLTTGAGRKLSGAPDIYGCTTVQQRYPDFRLDIRTRTNHDVVTVVAAEVTFRNGKFQKAMTVASSYLMPWTNVLYSLVIIINESEDRNSVESLEIFLLKRRDRIQAVTGAAAPNRFDCRFVPDDLRRATDPELEAALEIEIVRRVRFLREDVIDLDVDMTFNIPSDAICHLSGLPRATIQIEVLTFDLRNYCNELFEFSDDLVAGGTYPDRIGVRIPHI